MEWILMVFELMQIMIGSDESTLPVVKFFNFYHVHTPVTTHMYNPKKY